VRRWALTAIVDHDYTYDEDGNLETQDIDFPFEANSSEGFHDFAHDRSGRLTSWTPPGTAAVTYDWDEAGNRIAAGADTFTYDERNRLVEGSEGDYSYSSRGDLLSIEDGATTTTFEYDALGRLVDYDGQASFSYDSLDRVAQRGTAAFSYAGTDLDPAASGSELYSRDPGGELLAFSDGAGGALAGLNRHGDLSFGFDAQGALSLTRVFEPFGDVAAQTGTTDPALGFQGDYTDPLSGQVWMGARWYEPGTASFLTRDTVQGDLSSPVSLNRYTYGFADPLEYLDPDGRFSFSLSGFLSGIGGFVSGLWSRVTSFASGVYSAATSLVSRWGSAAVATRGSAAAQARPPAQTASSGIAKAMVAMHRLAIATIAGASRGPVSARGVPVAQTQTPATSSGEQGEQGLLDHVGGFFKGAWDAGAETVKGLATMGGNLLKWSAQCMTLQSGCVRGVQAAGRVAKQVITNPVATAKAIAAPVIEAVKKGNWGEAIGHVGGVFAGGFAAGAAAKVAGKLGAGLARGVTSSLGQGAFGRIAEGAASLGGATLDRVATVGQKARSGLRSLRQGVADLGTGISTGFARLRGRLADETGAIGKATAPGSIPGVRTPYGVAAQADDAVSMAARAQVSGGTPVYRMGTTGKSHAAEGQFWSLEHPSAPGFAERYGIPPENVANADFIASGVVRSGAPFITRTAPGVGTSAGGGIEVVVPEGGVRLHGFSYCGPKGC